MVSLFVLFTQYYITGKTYLYNTIIRWCLAGMPQVLEYSGTAPANDFQPQLNRGSVISCATTGIAALLLIGGGTVHRQLRVPNEIDSQTPSRIAAHTNDAERLRKANLIVIDV